MDWDSGLLRNGYQQVFLLLQIILNKQRGNLLCKVSGDSMVGAGIDDGDLILIDR
jgi:SOS-response transcriptional repressor LexA